MCGGSEQSISYFRLLWRLADENAYAGHPGTYISVNTVLQARVGQLNNNIT